MTPIEAERIVNEYGAVLERASSLVFGAPETLLPFDKDVIKQAIRAVLAFLKTNPKTSGEDITQQIENLKIGYHELASFIPVEDAKVAAEGNAALLSGDLNHPGWAYADRALEIASENLARNRALADELASFLNSF
jgi:hypothetical protein